MNLVRITASALLAAATTACIGLSNASTTIDDNNYRVITFKDCKKVREGTLNNEQIAAYQQLKREQEKLESLELPLTDMEQQVTEYSQQIEAITEKAVVEDENHLRINKDLLKEQDELTHKLDSLIAAHDADFKALNEQAKQMEKAAKLFDEAMKPMMQQGKSTHLQILAPGEAEKSGCFYSI
jgi:chromosome segregation ATPase